MIRKLLFMSAVVMFTSFGATVVLAGVPPSIVVLTSFLMGVTFVTTLYLYVRVMLEL